MKRTLLLLLLFLLLAIVVPAHAEDDVTNPVYLPLVQNGTPEEQFVIDRVQCPYVFIKYVNPSFDLDKSYTAGLMSFDKLGGGDLGFAVVHHWYDTPNTVWYWTSYNFDIWGLYYLDAWVRVPGGYVWVSNGEQLWYPCPPHSPPAIARDE